MLMGWWKSVVLILGATLFAFGSSAGFARPELTNHVIAADRTALPSILIRRSHFAQPPPCSRGAHYRSSQPFRVLLSLALGEAKALDAFGGLVSQQVASPAGAMLFMAYASPLKTRFVR